MNRIARGALILGAMAVAAGAVCYWAVKMLTPPGVPLPNPNGYDDFIAAGKMLNVDSQSNDLEQATTEQLRAFFLANHAALERLRVGLGRRCRVPIRYSASGMEAHINELVAIKRDARTLLSEGRLAELENRPADAAASYLAGTKLAINAAHGGALIDLLVSIACESLAVNALAKEFHTLNASQSRQLARQLEELDREREPVDRILEQERNWGGITRHFEHLIYRLINIVTHGSDPVTLTRKTVIAKYQAQQRQALQLEANLAARACELEKGRAPTGWNDLVPAYLARIPTDPATQSNLDYNFGAKHRD